ncbi:MAG TPA: Maf family protein, partial [Pseudomonadales bacterium]|nr:Maf family protein [Pseudomonadales bacterium]
MSDLILASGSPRRRTLLHQLGLRFSVLVPDIDEALLPDEPARDYVFRMSTSKFDAAREAVRHEQQVVICADTVVIRDAAILGKPADEAECVEMLMSLSGREHSVVTSVTLGRSEPVTLSSETI